MQRIAITILAMLLLSSVQARSQDALATFIFLFVDPTIDVTRSYGTEWINEVERAPLSIKRIGRVRTKYIFELSEHPTDKNYGGAIGIDPAAMVDTLERWDFNKAFFTEAKIGQGNYFIPGESGIYYREFSCALTNCDSTKFESAKIESDQISGLFFAEPQRYRKALTYFVQNFCPGVKRKSAF